MQVLQQFRANKLVLATVLGVSFAIAAVMLAACNLTSTGDVGYDAPDVYDQVRRADLQPRFPRSVEDYSGLSSSRHATVYPGAEAGSLRVDGAQVASGENAYELNFENTPVNTVAKVILGDILGVGYAVDPRVQGTISLASGHPVPKNDVLFVLESALRTANVVLVHDTGGYRLIPVGDAAGNGAIDRVTGTNRPEPGYGISVIPLKYVSVQTIVKLLDSFATRPGAIRADLTRNMLVIVGTGVERRAGVEAALSFDADWMRGQSVGIYPVHNSAPETLITELEKIIDSGEGGLSQNMVKFQPVSRSNSILVVSHKPELLKTVGTWITRLDRFDTEITGVKVYRVRYGDARQLARLLNDMFTGAASGGLDSPTNQLAPDAGATTMSSSAAPPPISPTERLTGGPRPQLTADAPPAGAGPAANLLGTTGSRSSATGGAILPDVRITPDVVNNALLIYANQESYRIIERTLRQLDRPQQQVAIDLTIAEVTLNANLNYGVQFYLNNANFSLINTAASAALAETFPGFNFLIGSQASPHVILNALHGMTDVKVLSNPSLVVVDNGTATLEVGDQVPVTTGTATVLSANNAVVNTINYESTGIILHVVPRISPNGSVRLDIEQEISSVPDTNSATSLTPTISERKVKSSLVVPDGQTVLLAGLISETQSKTRSGIPLLDQIPKIGDVFSQTTRSSDRTELIIFIHPQVIRDSVDASFVAEELRTKLRGSKIGVVDILDSPTPGVPPRYR